MKTVAKEQLLDTLENRIENHLSQAIGCFQNLTNEELLQAASDGGWSIAQCLEHLNSYGDYYLPRIGTALQKVNYPSTSKNFKSSWLGDYFIRMMNPETGKKKYKAFKGHIPAPDLDGHAVVAKFIQQQEELLGYVKQAHHADLNALKISISIARFIKLKLGDVFQFIIAHNERHLRQAMRNVQNKESYC